MKAELRSSRISDSANGRLRKRRLMGHDWTSMKLKDLAGILSAEFDGADVEVTGVSSDSRRIEALLPLLAHDYPNIFVPLLALERELKPDQREPALRYVGQRVGAWVYTRDFALGGPEGSDHRLPPRRDLSGAAVAAAGGAAIVYGGALVYANYCLLCHGPAGKGDGPLAVRGVPPPPSLLADHAQQMKDGQLFHVLTYGQGNMAPYASQLSREDRWGVILHVRALQQQAGKGQP